MKFPLRSSFHLATLNFVELLLQLCSHQQYRVYFSSYCNLRHLAPSRIEMVNSADTLPVAVSVVGSDTDGIRAEALLPGATGGMNITAE